MDDINSLYLIQAIYRNASNEELTTILERENISSLNHSTVMSPITPLFVAIGCCNFRIADFLIEKGVDINQTITCYIKEVEEEDVMGGHFNYKYFKEYIDRDMCLDYYLYIEGNVLHFLCENELLNDKNAAYLFTHGYNLDFDDLNNLFGENSKYFMIVNKEKEWRERICHKYINDYKNNNSMDNYYENLLNKNRNYLNIINRCRNNTREKNLRICFPEKYNNKNNSGGNHICEKLDCNNTTNSRCPICKKNDIDGGFYCSRKCFKECWEEHKKKHNNI